MNREKLKSSIKRVADWTTPPRWQRLVRNCAYSLRGAWGCEKEIKKEVKKNIEFKNLHKGKRCFILCTGPSVKTMDLKRLKNENCIAVSFFSLHEDYKIINPQYHVLAPWHPPFEFDEMERKFASIAEKKCPETIIFLGHYPYKFSYLNYFRDNPQLKPQNSRYIYYGSSHQLDDFNYNQTKTWDITKHPFLPKTVLYCAIQLAVYMGFEEIYLLGVDQNYLEYINQKYYSNFYPDEKRIDDSANWKSKTEEVFISAYGKWHQFGLMQDYLNRKGQTIFNASPGSFLDVFPQRKLDDVIR